jgi:hypothetical protein
VDLWLLSMQSIKKSLASIQRESHQFLWITISLDWHQKESRPSFSRPDNSDIACITLIHNGLEAFMERHLIVGQDMVLQVQVLGMRLREIPRRPTRKILRLSLRRPRQLRRN